MIKKLIGKFLQPFIKNEEDRARLSTVIIPSFIVRSGYFVLSLLINILLTRTLGTSRYGVFSYTASMIFILMNFSANGFDVLTVRYTSSYLSKGEKGLWKGLYKWASRSIAIVSTLVGALAALFIWVFVYILHLVPATPYTLPVLVSCAIIPVYSVMNFYIAILRGQHKSLLSFLPDSTVKPLFLLIALVLFRLLAGHMRLGAAIGLNMVSFVVALVFVYIVYKQITDMSGIKAEYDKKNWKKFVGSLFILTCVTSLSARLDLIMLGSIKDSSQVGIYNAADKYASGLFFFLNVMNMIILPSIARLNALEDKEKLQKMITRTIRWVMLFTLPVFIGMVVFSPQIMHLSGSEFVPGKSALIIICCGQLFNIAFGPVGSFALMTGHQKYNTIYMAIGIVINITLNLILTPRMGFNGTAISTSVSMIFWNAAMFITIRKKTGIRTWIFG